MKFSGLKLFLVGVSCIGMTGCGLFSEKEVPFESIDDLKLETFSGELFPFSASITTKATHRLELDGKLQAYLASRVFNLGDFEGRKIEVEGVVKEEKMRPIFWVKSIKLLDIVDEVEESAEIRFATKKFTFLYPRIWDYTTAPNGTVYFTRKEDVSRKVFLTFSIDDLVDEDKKKDFNVVIADLNGIKTIETLKNSREKEVLTLFSNISDKKYTFVFTNNFDDFESKKSYFKLLQSFKEGAVQVSQELEKERAVAAQKSLELLQKNAENEAILEKIEDAETTEEIEFVEAKEAGLFADFSAEKSEEVVDAVELGDAESIEDEKLLDAAIDATEDVEETEVIVEDETDVNTDEKLDVVGEMGEQAVVDSGEFTNLIDRRAYSYESRSGKFSVKIPYGFWFQNFGTEKGIGIASHSINGASSVEVWLKKSAELFEKKEMSNNGELMITKGNFIISGDKKYRDLMWSVLESISE